MVSSGASSTYVLPQRQPRYVDDEVGGAGGTVVVHISLTTVTRVRFRLLAVI